MKDNTYKPSVYAYVAGHQRERQWFEESGQHIKLHRGLDNQCLWVGLTCAYVEGFMLSTRANNSEGCETPVDWETLWDTIWPQPERTEMRWEIETIRMGMWGAAHAMFKWGWEHSSKEWNGEVYDKDNPEHRWKLDEDCDEALRFVLGISLEPVECVGFNGPGDCGPVQSDSNDQASILRESAGYLSLPVRVFGGILRRIRDAF
jgi:hypothetical protein